MDTRLLFDKIKLDIRDSYLREINDQKEKLSSINKYFLDFKVGTIQNMVRAVEQEKINGQKRFRHTKDRIMKGGESNTDTNPNPNINKMMMNMSFNSTHNDKSMDMAYLQSETFVEQEKWDEHSGIRIKATYYDGNF